MKEVTRRIKNIKPELRALLTEFLAYPEYQDLFRRFAKIVGYDGDDEQMVKNVLFTPNIDGDIMFSIEGMYQLFLEFQLMKQLSDKPMFKELLLMYPEAITKIRQMAIKVLNKEEVTSEDMDKLFDTDEYERRRTEAGPREN